MSTPAPAIKKKIDAQRTYARSHLLEIGYLPSWRGEERAEFLALKSLQRVVGQFESAFTMGAGRGRAFTRVRSAPKADPPQSSESEGLEPLP
jgi:hypothetical protein